MIPTLTLHPEYFCTYPPRLAGFHVKDENGKTVGVIPADKFYQAIQNNDEYMSENSP